MNADENPLKEEFNCEWVYQNSYKKHLNLGLVVYTIAFLIVIIGTFVFPSVILAFAGMVLGLFSSSHLSGYGYMFNLHYNKKDSVLPFSIIYTMGNVLMVLWILLLI
jgi:hypothetical protein